MLCSCVAAHKTAIVSVCTKQVGEAALMNSVPTGTVNCNLICRRPPRATVVTALLCHALLNKFTTCYLTLCQCVGTDRLNCLVLAKVGRRKKDGSKNPGLDREPSGRDKAEQLAYRHTDKKNMFCCHLENPDFIG